MLSSLSIRNVVIIDKLDLSFDKGLCVFTGETGAGKSILLDSLSLVLGARAEAGLVRHGEERLSVSATFVLPRHHAVWHVIDEQGLACEGEELFLRRIVTCDGKSKAFINDEPVSISFLKKIGEMLVEIHGQFATHGLLNPATHLGILDTYAGLEKVKKNVSDLYQQYRHLQNELQDMEKRMADSAKEEEFLKNAISDLEMLNIQPDEEEALTIRRTQLMNSEKIITSVDTAYQIISSEEKGVLRQLSLVSRQLEKVSQYLPERFDPLIQSVHEAQEIMVDLSGELENIGEEIGDVSELSHIDNRLFMLKDMARRYQVSVQALPTLLTDFRSQMNQLEKGEDYVRQCRQKVAEIHQQYLSEAHILSDNRRKAAQKLDKAVARELPALKLEKATFCTQIISCDDNATAEGVDTVSFMVSTNIGTPPAPLNKVASGGELARFMLALKVNLAQAETTDTLIFDEVDSGVGGATAAAVGERLARLGQECQVLVVTHSPQVASFGVQHCTVVKQTTNLKTITQVHVLDDEGRLMEIARMLSGTQTTQTARVMAQELLDKANAQH
ncbi:MAG: DNA repair protein RecN [Alphaproteobacteria bacterium]|nr:DNA repair protein RecN [Alphaproteobacteria bacterium]